MEGAVKHSPGFLAIVDDAKTRIREISVADVLAKRARGERFELVDVREDHEWDEGRARGARHVGRGILERDAERLFPDQGTEIVLYCGGGYRSALAADNLQKMGYRNVASMAGGFKAWEMAKAPVVRD